MNSILTVALFVLGAAVVVFFSVVGLFSFGTEIQPQPADPSRLDNTLRRAGAIVPPLLLVGSYVAGIVATATASGSTVYYPVIAMLVGVAAWYGALRSLSTRLRRIRAGEKTVDDLSFERRHLTDRAGEHPIRDAAHAIAVVAEHIRSTGMDYPATGLTAERIGAGWLVYAPATAGTSDPAAFSDTPVGRAVFLIGDSGHIEQTSTPRPPQSFRPDAQ